MRILFVHPEDEPLAGGWADQTWNRVIDLGFAGEQTYQQWRANFGCSVEALPRLNFDDLRTIRKSLLSPLGRLVDSEGLDWWELIGIRFHEVLERMHALKKIAVELSKNDEVFFSRSCVQSQVMEILHPRKVRCYPQGISVLKKLRHVAVASLRLGVAQSLQIAADKYDATYRLRRFAARRAKGSQNSVTLLPSAYVNASRTAMAYASVLPNHDFLLVATRRSGRLSECPRNVRVEKLASYAPRKTHPDELQFLQSTWNALRQEIADEPGLAILGGTGLLDSVPRFLHEGVAIRDAWLRVFNEEPVNSVLCTDDSNPYTRIPLLIASQRKLAAVACHHGALDGRHLIKRCRREVTVLAKGEMERDYLASKCGIPQEQIEIGTLAAMRRIRTRSHKDSILFFSEPYELSGGRCLEFYREVLRPLVELATATDRKLIIKLHPQESRRERQRMVRAVLLSHQFKRVQIADGVLRDGLLNNAWCAVTIISTTAVDCALRGIPVFLCRWLDHTNYGYGEQFVKFGVGAELNCASEIYEIPRRIQNFSPAEPRNLWEPVCAERFRTLLTSAPSSELAAAV